MRQAVLAANWKMYKNRDEARAFVREFLPLLKEHSAEVIICPPAPLLYELAELLAGSGVQVAAQNIHWEQEGAYTGEISAAIARHAGAAYTLLGHSERRQYFGESSSVVAQKARAALAAGLMPIVCVGETLAERQSGAALVVLREQTIASLAGIEPNSRLIIAYEPVWAIGTGAVATPEDAEQAIAHIRAVLRELWGQAADTVRILYGGSVKPENTAALLASANIDGALVGGASLSPTAFAAIVNSGQ